MTQQTRNAALARVKLFQYPSLLSCPDRSRNFPLYSTRLSPEVPLILNVPTAEDMEDLGGMLATLVLDEEKEEAQEVKAPVADLILLDGDLGAGKTALSRGFIRTALGDFDLQVTSPTYLLTNTYKSPYSPELEIQHIDLYRLTGIKPNELIPLNLDHVFQNCVALIEWPQRMGVLELPLDRLDIFISITDRDADDTGMGDFEKDHIRRVKLTPYGERWAENLLYMVNEGFLDDLLDD